MRVAVSHIWNGPVLPDANTIVLYRERVTRRQLKDIFKYSPGRKRHPECKDLVHALWVNFSGHFGIG